MTEKKYRVGYKPPEIAPPPVYSRGRLLTCLYVALWCLVGVGLEFAFAILSRSR